MRFFRLAVIAACFAIYIVLPVAAASLLATDSSGGNSIHAPHEKFTLPNGLTVILHSDRSSPNVFVGVWYGVGSRNEPPGRTGFAHLFEHLMFQETRNRSADYISLLTNAGASSVNGTTSEDRTNYYVTVPTGALELALWMESDRMINFADSISQEMLDEQREVVKNEKRQGANHVDGNLGKRIREGFFPPGHPYRHQVIGSMEDLDAASIDDVRDWHSKHYGARNAVLVLSGDINIESARERVTHYFSGVPSGRLPEVSPTKWVPHLVSSRTDTEFRQVAQERVTRVWALPEIGSKDLALMTLVSASLAGFDSSPLQRALIHDSGLATGVNAAMQANKLSGMYVLTVDLQPGAKVGDVNELIDETFQDFFAKGPDQQFLEDTKLGQMLSIVGAAESNEAVGLMLAEGELYFDDPLHINRELKWIADANNAQIRDVAESWLGRNYYQLVTRPLPAAVDAPDQADRSRIPDVGIKSTVRFPDIEVAVLDNGMELIVAQRSKIPVVDVLFWFDAGSLADPVDAPGLSDIAFTMMNAGTTAMNITELTSAMNGIAMRGGFSSGRVGSQFTYRILSDYLDESFELAAEMVRQPAFPEEQIRFLKQNIAVSLENRRTSPAEAGDVLFATAIFGRDSLLGRSWQPGSVDNISRDDLVQFHRERVSPQRTKVFMVGDIDMLRARELAEQHFGEWRGAASPLVLGEAYSALPRRSKVILIDQPGAKSSTIRVGQTLRRYDPMDSTDLSILNTILGGSFGSRLNMRLREEKGWSYGVSSSIVGSVPGSDQYLVMGGQFQTDRTADSMQEILKSYRAFSGKAKPPSAREVEAVKESRLRALPLRFNSNVDFLASIANSSSLGRPLDFATGTADQIANVSTTEVQRLSRELLDADALTWLIIGDLSRIEDSIRALDLGDVEQWDVYGNVLK